MLKRLRTQLPVSLAEVHVELLHLCAAHTSLQREGRRAMKFLVGGSREI